MAEEPHGELEVGGVGGAQDERVGRDASVGVILARDGVAGDRTVLRGPKTEGVPARPALFGAADAYAGKSLDPRAGGGERVPGDDQLAEWNAGLVDGADRLTAV
jgi:hypothetical protein